MKFEKVAKTSEEHYYLLVSRGLEISDKDRFIYYVEHIGYYRLTGYMYPFQKPDGSHMFKEKISFDKVLNHYLFDKKLRFLTLEVIERIEVAVRAKICNTYSLAFGSHWYENSDLFDNQSLHMEFLEHMRTYCADCNDQFIKEYNRKYKDPILPPGWMIMETLTFGKLASLFENLKDNDQKKEVAKEFGVVVPLFESWLKSINFVRNCCAHHSRLWNRALPIKPKIPTKKDNRFLNDVDLNTNLRMYGILSCIVHILNNINPNSKFKSNLRILFDEYPDVNIFYMGFKDNYLDEPHWQED